jgi:hypothetical protein
MNEGTSAANYLKVLDGQSVKGVPQGELFCFWQKWPQGGMKEVFAEPQPGASPRYKINVVVHEDGALVAKVFEFGPRVYDSFAAISEELDLSKTKIQISRKGSAKATAWTIIPLGPVDAKTLKAVAAVQLNPLGIPGANAPATEQTADGEPEF